MITAIHRRQIAPLCGLLALAAAALLLQSLGMHPAAALIAGCLLGASGGAAAWGVTQPGASTPDRLRWLLWPQIAAVITITWLAYLHLIPAGIFIFPSMDKVLHFTLFGAVTFFAELWLRDRRVVGLPVSIVLPATLATIEEGLQHFSPHRTMDAGDLLCDFSGMILAFLLARVLYRSGR
jgi:hypothetical protein